jgi:hypothetical protein
MFYSKTSWKLLGFEKSHNKNKMYNAIIQRGDVKKKVPFGDTRYGNYGDKTGLNAYPHLVTGNAERRRLYKIRHSKDILPGYFSPGFFSMNILW